MFENFNNNKKMRKKSYLIFIFLLSLFETLVHSGNNNQLQIPIRNEECVAKDETICRCTSKLKQPFIEDLLGESNLTPDNYKLFKELFADSEYLIDEEDHQPSNQYHHIIHHDLLFLSNEQTNRDSTNSLLFTIECVNKSLIRVPKFKELGYSKQPYINCLDFQHNNLDYVSDSQFYGLLIKCIDFSHNKLFKIARNAFSGLLNLLLIIKLDHNNLSSNNTLPIYFASKLTLLQAILMSNNKLDSIYARSFTGVYSPNLKLLDLSSNQIKCIHEDAFLGLSSLKYLNLCRNKLSTLYSNCSNKLTFLKHLQSLEHLKLCSNKLETIQTGRLAFRYSKQLKNLDLSENNLISLYGLFCPIAQTPDSISQSPQSNETTTNYMENMLILNMSHNHLTQITINDLNCMENLEELYLNDNKISYIDSHSFKHLLKLKVLYLNNNPRLIPYPSVFAGLENSLKHLKLNFDQHYKYNYDFETVIEIILLKNGLHNLEVLDLSGSNFEIAYLNLAHYLLTSVKLQTLICSNCSIKYLKFKYELLHGENRIYSSSSQIDNDNFDSESAFTQRYIQYVCPRKLLGKKLNISLEDNQISECQTTKPKLKDDIDYYIINSNNNVNSTSELTSNYCNMKWIYFIKLLMNNIIVKKFNCFDLQTRHNVNWQSFNTKKFKSFIKKHNCSSSSTMLSYYASISCSSHFYLDSNRNLILKANKSNSILKGNIFQIQSFLILAILVYEQIFDS